MHLPVMETNNDPWSPLVKALIAYDAGDRDARVVVYDDLGDRDEWEAGYFFRKKSGMPAVERRALELCRGEVLDIGAGAGCHALSLQESGVNVTALEPDPDLVRLMRRRGVDSIIQAGIHDPDIPCVETGLLMMNGLGLAGTKEGLLPLLSRLRDIVVPGGQVLADSTDMRQAFDDDVREDGRYLGEVTFQFEYRGERAVPFPYLYVAPDLLESAGREAGWRVEVVLEDGPSFLSRLTRL